MPSCASLGCPRPRTLPRTFPPGRNLPAARRLLLADLVLTIVCTVCHARVTLHTSAVARCPAIARPTGFPFSDASDIVGGGVPPHTAVRRRHILGSACLGPDRDAGRRVRNRPGESQRDGLHPGWHAVRRRGR